MTQRSITLVMGWQVCTLQCLFNQLDSTCQQAITQNSTSGAAACYQQACMSINKLANQSTGLHVCNSHLCTAASALSCATVTSADCMCAEEDRLEVRRQTREQDKHLDTISDALSDLQRIGEVSSCSMPDIIHAKNLSSALSDSQYIL